MNYLEFNHLLKLTVFKNPSQTILTDNIHTNFLYLEAAKDVD